MGMVRPTSGRAGLRVTLRRWAGRGSPPSTRRSTEVKPQRFHGRHVLNRYPDGMEKCIGCELCAGACPARCIYVRGADNPPDAPVSPGERYGYIYEINMLRCIFCGLCVEACPTEAITMSQLFEMSTTNRDDAIYTRDDAADGHRGHRAPHVPRRSVGRPGRTATARWVAPGHRTLRARRLLRCRRLDPRRRHRPPPNPPDRRGQRAEADRDAVESVSSSVLRLPSDPTHTRPRPATEGRHDG